MAELSKGYKKIISDLEENIKDPKELEFVKRKISELTIMFMDTMDTLIDTNERNQSLERKVRSLQHSVEKIEEDIYVEDNDFDNFDDEEDEEDECGCELFGDQMHDNDYEFEILCPYCNHEFVTGKDTDLKSEIECPNCHNLIELDWDESCDGECDECKGHCCRDEEETKVMEDEDNDYKFTEGKLEDKKDEETKDEDDDM